MNSKSTNNFFNFSNRIDLTAVIKSEFSISYQKLFDQSMQIAFALSNKGIKKDNHIPLLIEDNFLFIKTVIAFWYLGAIPVPLNTKLLDDEINSILDEYDFNFLVTDSSRNLRHSFESLSLGGKSKMKNIRDKDTKSQSFTKINLLNLNFAPTSIAIYSTPNLNDEAVVIFTSGSSERPKGVVHTFSSLINSIENSNAILNPKENDRWLASLPFYHIGGFQIICRSLFHGCAIVIPASLQTKDLADSIINHKPTHLSLVSTQLERLINQKVVPDKSLRVSLIGGGFVEDDLMFDADKLGWKPYRVYSSSETASMITAISANETSSKPQSVGKTFCDVEIRISNESEILIKSKSLFIKYLGDKKVTSAKLSNEFYHSGDLGFIDDDGYLFIEARRNDLIVTGGENVNPIEVEKEILKIAGITDVCVFPKQDKTWGQIVAAAIVLNDKSFDEKSIKEYLKQKLTGYKIPKKFFFVDKLPKTSLGKLEREKIRKMF